MSRERRDIRQRKIRRIKRLSDESTFQLESPKEEIKPIGIKPNTKMYYSKVIFGVTSGTITGLSFILFGIEPQINIFLFLVFILFFLSICVFFIRYILRISPDEITQRRLWLSGTFTFVLLFIVTSSLIWMLPGPSS